MMSTGRMGGALALVLGFIGCISQPELSTTMVMTFVPDDFQTNFLVRPSSREGWVGVLGVRWEGYLDTDLLTIANDEFPARIFLVSLATGARVPGRVRPAIVSARGAVYRPEGGSSTGGYSFLPDSDLAEGWYVLVVDTTGFADTFPAHFEFGPRPPDAPGSEDGLYFRRVHVGSLPAWYRSEVNCNDGTGSDAAGCRVGVEWSEPVDALGSTAFTLSVDGHDCGAIDAAELGAAWTCPPFSEGTRFEITLATEGTVRRLSPSSHSQTLVGGGLSRVSVPVDADFGIEAARGAL